MESPSTHIQFYNLLQETVQRLHIDYSKEYIRDGLQDDYPARILNMVQRSVVASALTRIRRSFLEGAEIIGKNLDIPSPLTGYTPRDTIRLAISDFALSDRAFFLVMPMKRGSQISDVSHIPFEYVRMGLQNEQGQINYVYTNPFLNTPSFSSSSDRYYPIYTGNQIRDREAIRNWDTAEFGEYKGHVLIYQRMSPFNRIYSRPDIMNAENFVRADAGLGQFHANNIESNFFLGGIMHVFGSPGQKVSRGTDKDGNEIYETLDEQIRRTISTNFSGAKNAGSVMVMYFTNTEAKASFEKPPVDGTDKMFMALSEEVTNKLCIAANIPKVLLGVATEGKLGQTNEFRNAFNYMNQNTAADRAKFEQIFSQIFNQPIEIKPLSPDTELPDSVFASLDASARAEYIEKQFGLTVSQIEIITSENQKENENGNPAN